MGNREIKFRIWDKRYKSFYGTNDFKNYHYSFTLFQFSESFGDGVCFTEEEKNNYTLQQFTGLKDKNGKKIYEGDYVKCYSEFITKNPNKDREIGKVIWHEGAFGIANRIIAGDKIYESPHSDLICFTQKDVLFGYSCEVIGNIFENPELEEKITIRLDD